MIAKPSRMHLFESKTNGYYSCRIPGLAVTSRGVVLATVESRKGKGGDYDDSDIRMRRSVDGGMTWDDARVIVSSTAYGAGPVHNFVMIGDRSNGVVHAVFCHDYARIFHMRSEDDGQTFPAPVEITSVLEGVRKQYPWVVAGTGPGHGLQLRNGRFVIPTWFSDGSGKEMGKGKRGHRPSVVASIYSDDHGRTWQSGDIVARPGNDLRNPSETVAVELSDGSVLFNIRNESAAQRRLVSISPDGARGWTAPRFDAALLEPVCMGSILRLQGDANRVIFCNPDTVERTMRTPWGTGGPPNCDRKNLAIQVSYDDCRTWPVKRVLEPGPSGYSDLAQLPDGTILCLYEQGEPDGFMCDDRYVTCARFSPDWLMSGPNNQSSSGVVP